MGDKIEAGRDVLQAKFGSKIEQTINNHGPSAAKMDALDRWAASTKRVEVLEGWDVTFDVAHLGLRVSWSTLTQDVATALSARLWVDYNVALPYAQIVVTKPNSPEQWMRARGLKPLANGLILGVWPFLDQARKSREACLAGIAALPRVA